MVRAQEAEGQNGGGEQKQGADLAAAFSLPGLLWLRL